MLKLKQRVVAGQGRALGGLGRKKGGTGNTASGNGAFISGGGYYEITGALFGQNVASGVDSVVVGGSANYATNCFSTVPGGLFNIAGGYASFAARQQAQALHQGAFVWADRPCLTFCLTSMDY